MLTLRLERSNIYNIEIRKGVDSLNIREKRESLGMSQKELADRCGIAQSTLCDIEQRRCKPSIETAIKLAKELNVADIKFFE